MQSEPDSVALGRSDGIPTGQVPPAGEGMGRRRELASHTATATCARPPATLSVASGAAAACASLLADADEATAPETAARGR